MPAAIGRRGFVSIALPPLAWAVQEASSTCRRPKLKITDVTMPDLHKTGGLLEGRKIADMAHAYYVPFAPHNVTSPIGTMAAAHTRQCRTS